LIGQTESNTQSKLVTLPNLFLMLMKIYKYIVVLLLLSACKPHIHIDNAKVAEVLTQYGNENAEKDVVINTAFGDIEIHLYDETPLHRANFVRNIKLGYYKERDFYRIIKGTCIQGGSRTDPQDFTIPAEFRPNLIHKRGTIAMARYTEDNPEKRSSPTEFFIISKGKFYNAEELANYPEKLRNTYLAQGGEMLFDQEYTVFGEVTKGMDIVDKIAHQSTAGETPNVFVKFTVKVK
jgi:cyclophilin family peptidyl-prolyl cis-trans isomerase